jgi:hypothetical protein
LKRRRGELMKELDQVNQDLTSEEHSLNFICIFF